MCRANTVDFEQAASALRAARSVTVLTGAGVSAESGLPTFRDPMSGLWAKYRPEDLATPTAFRRDPKLVSDWYAWRRAFARNAEPNPAHLALAELQRRAPKMALITQNVDGLHQRAGNEPVIELHGSLFRVKCVEEGTIFTEWDETQSPPICSKCGGWLRPDVVWFGEPLPKRHFASAMEATRCDLFLSVGTSGHVEPAASLLRAAVDSGAFGVVINAVQIARVPANVIQLVGLAGEILPMLLENAWPDS